MKAVPEPYNSGLSSVQNATNPKELRLNATVWGDLLRDHISDAMWSIAIQNTDGVLKLKVDCLQARALVRMRMVAGTVRNGTLRYLVARVPLQTIIRVLRMDPPKPGEISKPRQSDMQWAVRYDRAKGGRLGGTVSMGGFYHAA